MSNIAIFEPTNLPAFLRGVEAVASELSANVGGGGFPVLSIKGKLFTMVRDGEREVMLNPNDRDEPATSINVVILKANAGLSKVWYAKNYVEGSDAKPDCFSHDGVAPDPIVENPQSAKCAVCPKNQWGSKMSDDGKKLKACSDSRRVAIANVDTVDDAILLRVPPASLRPLADYGNEIADRGAPYYAVVTKVSFDREAASPKLTFKAVGWLTAEQFAAATTARDSELVSNILGVRGTFVPVIGDDAAPEVAAEAPKAAEPVKAAKAAAKPAAAKAAPVVEKAVPMPEATPEVAKPAPVKIVSGDSLEDELDALLGSLDD